MNETKEEDEISKKKTRIIAFHFIQETGRKLKLGKDSVATSHSLFHRFFANQNFSEHDKFVIFLFFYFFLIKKKRFYV